MSGAASATWLERYRGPSSLREGRHFDLVTATRAEDRAAVVVVRPGPEARPDHAAKVLGALVAAHRAIAHPRVPAVGHAALEGERVFVELECDVAIDGRELCRLLFERGTRLPWSQALALRDAWRDAMEAAHGAGYVLGRASLADLWISAGGDRWIVGFGGHVSLARDDGGIDPVLGAIEPFDVAAGLPPTPASDFALLLLLERALMVVSDAPTELVRGLGGAPSRALDERLALEHEFLTQRPASRPSFAEGVARLASIDRALGVAPDEEGLARTIEGTLARSAEREVPALALVEPTEKVVTVDQEGAWVDSEAGRTTLGPSLRAILAHLLELRRTQPGKTCTLWELLEVGWPGEQPRPDSGANRVYAAISRLRKLGLLGALEWHEGGYRIAPSAPLTTIG